MTDQVLLEKVEEVAHIRERAAVQAQKVKELRADFEASIATEVFGAKLLSDIQAKAEEELKHLSTNAYDLDRTNKKPAPGVTIKLFTQLGYEPGKAKEWAIEHKMALALDVKAFEAIAKTAPMDFVIVLQVPKATIATDLTKALEESNAK